MIVLGISGAFGHDAAAALVIDGAVVAASEEERFTRTKRAVRQPAMHSVQACLDFAQISLAQVDHLAIAWDPRLAPADHRLADNLSLFLSSYLMTDQKSPPMEMVPHHAAHATLGYFSSGFDDAAVLVVDGQSEDAGTTIFHGQGGALTKIMDFGIEHSLGFLYAAVTRYLGFKPGAAGTTMGLAALGAPTYAFPEVELLSGGYSINMPGESKPARMSNWLRRFDETFGQRSGQRFHADPSTGNLSRHASVSQSMQNAAASIQAILERTMQHLAVIAANTTRSSNLVLSGGVALNCTSNGRLRDRIKGGTELHVNGASGDGGTALGAALVIASQFGSISMPERETMLFLGPSFNHGKAIDHPRSLGLIIRDPTSSIAVEAAQQVLRKRVGGWFRGRSEYGPRALGARSIIARADDPGAALRVNRIKGREAWRPIAPAITAAVAQQLGLDTAGLDFMVEARWPNQSDSPSPVSGILHRDGSMRPLLVRSADHPFYDLLDALESLSSRGAVINTSFNLGSEPIVNSPLDALRTFASSDLDFLALEDVLIQKPGSDD